MITIMNTGAIYTDSTASVESCKLNLSGCWMRRCSLQRLLAFRRVASCCHVVDQKGRQRCTEEDSNNTGDLGDALLVILPGEDSCSYRHACCCYREGCTLFADIETLQAQSLKNEAEYSC